MKAENKYPTMIWAIVILAVMNISTIATIMYRKYQPEKTMTVTDQNQLEVDSEKFSGRYFREKLNLTMDQMVKFRAMNPVFRPQARDMTMELARKRKRMLIEMSAPVSDTAKLNALSDSIGQLHSDLKKVTYKYYIEIKNICDTVQQRKLEELFNEMFTNDSQLGFSPIGGPRGIPQSR